MDVRRHEGQRGPRVGQGGDAHREEPTAPVQCPAMAVDYFLKVEGIPGESLDAKHKDEIDVLGFSWGVIVRRALRTTAPAAPPARPCSTS